MAGDEKVRSSGEMSRPEFNAPVLPTVNPAVDKTEPPKSSIHPAVYIAYVLLDDICMKFNWLKKSTAHGFL